MQWLTIILQQTWFTNMPDPLVTFVIPVAEYHNHLVGRALASIEKQTVKATAITVLDTEHKGAGWARNHGLALVTSPFVVFLDADDAVEPEFVEQTLKAWDGKHYIYTDWLDGQGVNQAPDCASWKRNTWHVITALIPTAWAKAVGGFDETLPAFEDTDFYKKLIHSGYCGKRVPLPLFVYGKEGQRAASYRGTTEGNALILNITERYKGKDMACCGGETQNKTVANQPHPGFVLAEVMPAAGAGGQLRRGLATGNLYEYSYVGDLLWIDPADADHPRGQFKRYIEPKKQDDWSDVAARLAPFIAPPAPYQRMPEAPPPRDAKQVVAMWGAPKMEPEAEDKPATKTLPPRKLRKASNG